MTLGVPAGNSEFFAEDELLREDQLFFYKRIDGCIAFLTDRRCRVNRVIEYDTLNVVGADCKWNV